MISLKLLTAVFKVPIITDISIQKAYDTINGQELEWYEVSFNHISYPLDFVVRKCKEWALPEFELISYPTSEDGGWARIRYKTENIAIFSGDSEIESIFKACEWILERKK